MNGFVSASLEAVIELSVSRDFAGRAGSARAISAVVDTGFSDFLALPVEMIDALQLRLIGRMPMTLADGSEALVNAYTGFVFWQEAWRPTDILATDGAALIGMSLLSDSRITMDVRDGGAVSIISLF